MISLGLVDPRGAAGREPLVPAPRPKSLDGKSVLLIDNGKLGASYGPYAVLWDVVRERFPNTTWTYYSDNFLDYNDDMVPPIAARFAAEKPDAAILAFADAGVSLPTTLMAIELERLGIPTAIYANRVGERFVRGIYKNLAPGLYPIGLDVGWTDTTERVGEVARAALDSLVAEITERPGGSAAPAPAGGPSKLDSATDWPALTDSMLSFQDWAEREELGDGLPLIPPSGRAVEAVLNAVTDDPDEVIFGPALTSGRMLRVRDAAAAAVMTACPPRAFPVILAALRAMTHSDYILNLGNTTTHPSGNAVVFSGKDAARYGLSGAAGCLGPGHRGNASTGRAVQLALSNIFGARPGGADLTALGSSAEFTYCFAEAVAESPWPSLADEIAGGASGVLVLKLEAPRNVLDQRASTPEGLCEAFAGTATGIGSNNSYIPGDLLVIVNPEHARIFTTAGWTRADLAQGIYELARIPRRKTEGHGVLPRRPAYMNVLDDVPVVRDTNDIHIVVAGSASIQSMIALPWGGARSQWHLVQNQRGNV